KILDTDWTGQVWIFSEDEIAKAVRKEDGVYQFETLPYIRIGKEFVSGVPYPDQNGITWFRTFSSVIVAYNEHAEPVERPEFPALIRQVVVGKDSTLYFGNGDHANETILKFADNAIRFAYAAASYEGKNSNMFKTMLDGFDRDWSGWSDLPVKEYVNLPPGEYTFKVIAQNLFGAESKPASYTFTILPPWWSTWWAYFGYIILIGGSIYAVYNYQLRQRLQKAEAQRLRELDAVKTKLYTNITHEFRTPLTVILGMAYQLMDNPKKHLGKGLKMIVQNGQSLLTMVNQMLDLSKLESGKLSLQYHHSDIISFLGYILDSFHSLAESKGIQIHFISVSDQFKMDFDEVRLQQVVSNIISNAIKFTPKGGHVYVSTETANDSFILKIKDTGYGIREVDLPHIFDRFYQTDDSHTRHGEGTGIGLALTRELVKLMQGTIEVKSKIGNGSEFEVVLPIRNISDSETTNNVPSVSIVTETNHEIAFPIEVAPHPSFTPIHNGNGSAHVLVADDNEDVLAFIASCLENEFAVAIAKNGQECEDLALSMTPDLIVMDVMMPFKDGFEVCKTLKTDERTSHIPIIMLTAKADLESKLQGLEQGADDYLTKPFHKKELLLRIKNLLDLRRHLQQHYRSSLEGSLSTNALQDVLQGLNINPKGNSTKDSKAVNLIPSIPLASGLENAFVIKVRKTIEAHMEEPNFDVEKLCRSLAMSHSQVHRKLIALTGLSATHFIRFVRLIKAKEMILNSGFSIAAIAYDCGFNDPAYFSRIFKQEFGVSPQVWREENTV
ncbi:ATP-binding protein, partial [Aquiflexum sp.]|uniref:hybrid sensor histidine kinase/response regulator transcription factor n=1 Tax=Aquiflexum sp. TaxID=1872584 RepID=UPI0035942D3E